MVADLPCKRVEQAGVDCGDFLVGGEHHLGTAILVHVAVRRIVSSLVGGAEIKRVGSRHLHAIGSRREPAERVDAKIVRLGSLDRLSGRVQQDDTHVSQTALTLVLHPVAVQVVPHAIADFTLWREHQTGCTRTHVFLIQAECHVDATGFVDVAVHRLVSPLVGRTEVKPLGSCHLNGVRRCRKARKVVETTIGRQPLGDRTARCIQQDDAHAVPSTVTRISDPIAVHIVPHTVVDLALRHEHQTGRARVLDHLIDA